MFVFVLLVAGLSLEKGEVRYGGKMWSLPWWVWILGAGALVLFRRWATKRRVALEEKRARDAAAAESQRLQKNPKEFTKDELLQYNGTNPYKPLLLALKGRVIDVTSGCDFYGPGGPYGVFAGKDASKAFAMMSLKEEDAHNDLTGVDEDHLKVLDDWYQKLTAKYPTVGMIR